MFDNIEAFLVVNGVYEAVSVVSFPDEVSVDERVFVQPRSINNFQNILFVIMFQTMLISLLDCWPVTLFESLVAKLKKNFVKKRNFGQKFWSFFVQNGNFLKITFFVQNQNFGQKSKFCSKINILVKNQIFDQKSNFGQKSNFRSTIKILVKIDF